MYTVWHVDKYKITFKLVINHWTNEILVTDICYLLTYLLTPWSRVLLEKLTGSVASQEIPRIFGT